MICGRRCPEGSERCFTRLRVGYDGGMRLRPLWPVVGIAAAPVVLAGLGLTHPVDLNPATASYWRTLHLLLLPIFPLLGVNLWWLLTAAPGAVAFLARTLALVYIAFYTALDVLAGVAAGLVVERASSTGAGDLSEVTGWLFTQANALAVVGVVAFLLACGLTGAVLVRRCGQGALGGALLLIAGAAVFTRSHVYFPDGVAAMLVMAVGFAWLQRLRLSPAAAVPVQPEYGPLAERL